MLVFELSVEATSTLVRPRSLQGLARGMLEALMAFTGLDEDGAVVLAEPGEA